MAAFPCAWMPCSSGIRRTLVSCLRHDV
jgi:hypothetical protein